MTLDAHRGGVELSSLNQLSACRFDGRIACRRPHLVSIEGEVGRDRAVAEETHHLPAEVAGQFRGDV